MNEKKMNTGYLIFLCIIVSFLTSFVSQFFFMQLQKEKGEKILSLNEKLKIEKQIASLKRVQKAFIEDYDKNFYNNNGDSFPKIDFECPDTMIVAKLNNGSTTSVLVNICDIEKELWK